MFHNCTWDMVLPYSCHIWILCGAHDPHNNTSCSANMSTDQVCYKIGTCNSRSRELDKKPDVRTDHLRIGSHRNKNTWIYVLHDPIHLFRTPNTPRSEADSYKHATEDIYVHDIPMPHRSHKWHQPCLIRWWILQHVWSHNHRFSTCTSLCHTVHKLEDVVNFDRNSKMLVIFVFVHTYHIPWVHCTGNPPVALRGYGFPWDAAFASPPSFVDQSFSWAF